MQSSPILIVTGPTGVGKSEAALEIAKEVRGEIVNADSIQVYKGFNIGSAKPGSDILSLTRHHMLDIIEPNEHIDAGIYAQQAATCIKKIHQDGCLPIVVGGTGLWIRALTHGLVQVPSIDPEIRVRLHSEHDELGPQEMHNKLKGVDPDAADSIHPNDAVRILRALEVFQQTGTPLTQLQKQHAGGKPRYDFLRIVMDREREHHRATLKARLDDMVSRGWLDEIRNIVNTWGQNVRGLRAVGYRQLLPHVLESQDLETALAQAFKSTWIYARRQRTWLRGQEQQTWHVGANMTTDAITDRVATWRKQKQ